MTGLATKTNFFITAMFSTVLILSGCGGSSSSGDEPLPANTPPPVTLYTAMPSAGAHGAISPSAAQMVAANSSVSFSATPDSGYVVDQWLVDGAVVQTSGASYQLSNVVANHTVSVTFRLPDAPPVIQFTVTPSAGAQGAIAPSTAQTVTSGSNISFNATPNTGYLVDQWFVDGVAVQTSGASYQLANVTANHTVSVTFRRPVAQFAYVTQYDLANGVLVCTVDAVSGLLSNCGDAGAHSVLDTIAPQAIAINNEGTIAYITAYNDLPYAYQCTINRNDGTFSACSATNITTPSGYDTQYGMIALNSSNTTAFIPDAGGSGRILGCPIISGFTSSICSDTGATGAFSSGSVGIALNESNTTAYIGNYSFPYVTQCTVNGSAFSSCSNKTGDGIITFAAPSGVTVNGAGNILYVSDSSSGNVYGCDTTANGPSEFSHCFVATAGISDAWGITINAQGTVAYVADYINTIHICPILPDGTFPTCTASSGFNSPVGIALLY